MPGDRVAGGQCDQLRCTEGEDGMTVQQFLKHAATILALMAMGAVIEVVVPMSAVKPWKNGRRGANLGFTALSLGSNWLLASLAAVLALRWRPAGLMAQLQWPAWLEIALGIVVLD